MSMSVNYNFGLSETSRKPNHVVHDVSSHMVSLCVIGKLKNPGMLSHSNAPCLWHILF